MGRCRSAEQGRNYSGHRNYHHHHHYYCDGEGKEMKGSHNDRGGGRSHHHRRNRNPSPPGGPRHVWNGGQGQGGSSWFGGGCEHSRQHRDRSPRFDRETSSPRMVFSDYSSVPPPPSIYPCDRFPQPDRSWSDLYSHPRRLFREENPRQRSTSRWDQPPPPSEPSLGFFERDVVNNDGKPDVWMEFTPTGERHHQNEVGTPDIFFQPQPSTHQQHTNNVNVENFGHRNRKEGPASSKRLEDEEEEVILLSSSPIQADFNSKSKVKIEKDKDSTSTCDNDQFEDFGKTDFETDFIKRTSLINYSYSLKQLPNEESRGRTYYKFGLEFWSKEEEELAGVVVVEGLRTANFHQAKRLTFFAGLERLPLPPTDNSDASKRQGQGRQGNFESQTGYSHKPKDESATNNSSPQESPPRGSTTHQLTQEAKSPESPTKAIPLPWLPSAGAASSANGKSRNNEEDVRFIIRPGPSIISREPPDRVNPRWLIRY